MNTIVRRAVVALVSVPLVVLTSACSSSSSSGSSTSAAAECNAACARGNGAHCTHSIDCATSCAQAQAATPSACVLQERAVLTCAGSATFVCDGDGDSEPVGCDAQLRAFSVCVTNSPRPDAGTGTGTGTDPGTGTGTGTGTSACASPGNSCGDCVAQSCCTEDSACNAVPDCLSLSTCLTRCISTDQPCTRACRELYPSATSLFDAAQNCVSSSCSYACTEPPAGCSHLDDPSRAACGSTGFPIPWRCSGGPPAEQVACAEAPGGDAEVYCCLQ